MEIMHLTTYRYTARHLPTNRSWVRERQWPHRTAFLAELKRWNAMDKNWVYTEVQN